MRKIELIGKGGGMRLFLAMALLLLLSLTVTGAENGNVTLEQINRTLVNINETMSHINATTPTPILPIEDALKIFGGLGFIALLAWGIIRVATPKTDPVTKSKQNDGSAVSSFDAKCESMGKTLTVALAFLLLILAAILLKDSILSASDVPSVSSIWAAIIIMAIVFLLLIYMGCAVDGTLDQGEMRRAIAGTFVLGFTMLIFFLARYEVKNQEIISAYLQMVGVIIGFYFGAKTALAGTGTGTSEGLAIEFVEVSEDKKNIILTIRNKGDNKLVVDKVYVTGVNFSKPFKTSLTIDPKTSNKTESLTLDRELEPESVIKIKVVANTGLVDEREHTVS